MKNYLYRSLTAHIPSVRGYLHKGTTLFTITHVLGMNDILKVGDTIDLGKEGVATLQEVS